MNLKKFALIHVGNDESYGLVFVSGELNRLGHKIKWFDGDEFGISAKVAEWNPDFICFSPLTTFFNQALALSIEIKKILPSVKSVFGGRHVFAVPTEINNAGVDIVVNGPVYGTVDRIISAEAKEVISGNLIPVEEMIPLRKEYYEGVPRMATRHRKYIMSHFGCMYNCSYCSNSLVRRFYGAKAYSTFCLSRRPISKLIEEAKIFLEYPTQEVSLEDDDILVGDSIEQWLEEFTSAWKREIGLPTYANVTPITVLNVSDKTLQTLASLVNSVQMGVQTARKESLKLFNRQFQTEEMVKQAYDRLTSFEIKVKLEFIFGLPVSDPVEDAIDSIKMAQRICAGTFVAAFPLMLYPGTELTLWCEKNNVPLNDECIMEWHTGIGSIKFDKVTENRIKNLTKMATFFVKYNIGERWMRALIDLNLTELSSHQLSECQYLESLIFRNGPQVEKHFDKILAGMKFKY